MIPPATISRYLQKKPVQEGIIAGIIKNIIQRICKTNEDIECKYAQWILYVIKASQELRSTIFLQRSYIIHRAEEKMSQNFHLQQKIKDIKFM